MLPDSLDQLILSGGVGDRLKESLQVVALERFCGLHFKSGLVFGTHFLGGLRALELEPLLGPLVKVLLAFVLPTSSSGAVGSSYPC